MFRRRACLLFPLVLLAASSQIRAAPVTFSPCSGSPTPYVLESFDITPYPAHASETITIVAKGKASVAMVEGSTIHTTFKQGPFTTPEVVYKLCSVSGGACPVSAGSLITTTMQHKINSFAGDGIASGHIRVLDPNGKELACVNVAVDIEG